jgi:2-dehydropantoate 2-reductase
MRTVIVGPGAMGCLFASCLTKNGADIWLLDKNEERARIIREQGITVEGLLEFKQQVRITSSTNEIKTADLIIISAKSYHTKEAILFSRPLIGKDTLILTLQNGLGNIETISEISGQEKVIAGVTSLGATLTDIGKLRFAGKGETVIGRIDAKIPVELRYIREIFNKCGFETRISRDIKGALWSKLIINTGINALTAITRIPNGKLIEYPGTRKIMRDAVLEAVKVAKRKRIKLTYDDPLAKVESVCEATAANISSMLQDVLRKKRTEVDFINGVIVRMGQESGIPVPVNSVLLDLVKTIEASYSLYKNGPTA